MAQMVMATFNDNDHADMAVDELEDMGYGLKDVSVISKENKDHAAKDVAGNTLSGAASGATTGGVIGGVAGLLAGAGVIPALAGLLIGGPIAAALGATGVAAATISGAVTGAAAGGLIGALMSVGMSKEDAEYYNETVDNGGIILAVPTESDKLDEVRNVFESHGATRIKEVSIND